MLIELDLNNNDAEALLRHCKQHQPSQGDFRENARLGEALEAVAAAIEDAMNSTLGSHDSLGTIDPQLLNAAVGLLGDEALAICWLSRPLRALGHKRPIDVSIEEALDMIGRLEHGFGA
ncbi:MAG: antitoxin Xre/MbcA/ParS toxin-binding domain-containing protein [Pseudomonas capeferrum]|uniref:antitoxin Xre/MbcA/ParS toxin-binding domain-containing protein n=1 Tax=Pseudomonas capeferrum TaxID=1495066 RepID=UPI003D14A1EF